MHNLISMEKISFSYQNQEPFLLKDLDFSLGTDQRIGIIGPNGQGKTTLLHLCVGLIRPQGGKIYFKDQALTEDSQLQELRKSIGLVFQNPEDQLFCPTALEDVAFGPLNLGFPAREARQIALETLETVGLYGFEHRVTHKISGGEKRLLSLATILAMRPEAMLLDEPTNGLDSETRDRLVEILNGLNLALVIVSHDWDFLDQTVNTLLTLEEGSVTHTDKTALHKHVHFHPSGHVPHEHKNGLHTDSF